MHAGQKISYNGSQVCLFPLDYMYCTQTSSPSSFSHCCGHPADWIGSYDAYPVYAPFDCHLVYQDSSGNSRAYSSDAPVWTPQGLQYVTVMFTHDNNPPSATSFSQGDLIAHTGTAGFVTGDHCHMDQSNIDGAQLVSYGIYCSGGNLCYALQGSQEPYDIFYLSGAETVVQTQGMTFQAWTQPPEPPSPGKAKYAILMLAGIRKRREENGRIKRYSDSI